MSLSKRLLCIKPTRMNAIAPRRPLRIKEHTTRPLRIKEHTTRPLRIKKHTTRPLLCYCAYKALQEHTTRPLTRILQTEKKRTRSEAEEALSSKKRRKNEKKRK